MRRVTALIFVLLMVAGLMYLRYAPSDPLRWHKSVPYTEDADFPQGAVRVLIADRVKFEDAATTLASLPRTTLLAGSTAGNLVTYVTRSQVFGFPDYTTLEYTNGRLKGWARLRFGRSDLGVNRNRLQRILGMSEL